MKRNVACFSLFLSIFLKERKRRVYVFEETTKNFFSCKTSTYSTAAYELLSFCFTLPEALCGLEKCEHRNTSKTKTDVRLHPAFSSSSSSSSLFLFLPPFFPTRAEGNKKATVNNVERF